MNKRSSRHVAALAVVATLLGLSAALPGTAAWAQDSGSIWGERAPLLDPDSETAIAELNGIIYVLGGYPSTRVYVDTVQAYDSPPDTWSYRASLPMPMHHTMAKSVNGKVYAIGGEFSLSGLADRGIFLNTVFEYDPVADTWTDKAS